MRTVIAVLTLVFATACASDRGREPGLEPSGPPVVDGPLTITPIRFTTNEAPIKTIDAEQGHLVVRERHDDPTSREITVRFTRFPSTSENPGPPIVYLAGGPGGSGTWSSAGDRFPLFQKMREVGDVIAFDQRGTWGTEPYMVCPGDWSYPLDQPGLVSTLETQLEPFLKECVDHWGAKADIAAYNTRESAEDLDALRRALGVEKLTLWGISYGTHLGLAYIRAHPDRVHRAILAGVEGPDHTYKSPARIDAVIHRVNEAILADPKAAKVMPDFIGSLRKTLRQLEREPATVTMQHPETKEDIDVVVGANDLRRAVYSALGEREDIVELVAGATPVLNGDFTTLGQLAIRSRLANRDLVMSFSMDCASGASPERREMIKAQASSALLEDLNNARMNVVCKHWPFEDLGEEYRSPIESDAQVLFISGTLDVKTPPENAEDILPGFPNGRHLVIDGGSHDDDLFLASPQIAESMIDFLQGREPRERIVLPPIRFDLP